MSEIKIFEKEEFGTIRVSMSKNGEPLFCLADVCRILDLSNPSMVAQTLKKDGLSTNEVIDSMGRKQQATFINEPNLYKAIFQSRKDAAEQFQDWVCKEVLPSIRKTGGYVSESTTFVEAYFSDLDDNAKQFLIHTLDSKKKLLEENKAKQIRIEEMQPKEDFFDAVTDSKDACDMGTVAKVLNCGIGRNKLFEILREEKVLMNNNRPYQRYVDSAYFRIIEQHFMKNGEECINFKTIVYQTGVSFIRKILKRRNVIR